MGFGGGGGCCLSKLELEGRSKNGTLKCDEHEIKGDPEVKREVQNRESV